ncbi:PREDICTED: uncharacterized protein LOC106104335 [Papilio polytes]|uniref:uncharacterized protein LOC106104335 n=1 Tax=Papilio polytes TaxID=76194 RepID=UPI0006766E0D|nr:PREDICTED: uncharacterized protein LOC106104335 [Papilio polytes]
MCSYIFTLICLVMFVNVALGQGMPKGAIGFPEIEENPKVSNKQDRQPVYLPSVCPENELYYPGDHNTDWICDCRPGYLYHPKTDKCWLAYQRGPCPQGQYLVLPKSTVLPICENNPCINDDSVMFNGNCTTLGAMIPCGLSYPSKVVWINAATTKVDCVKVYVENRFSSNDEEMFALCPPGCKRSINLQCTPDIRR